MTTKEIENAAQACLNIKWIENYCLHPSGINRGVPRQGPEVAIERDSQQRAATGGVVRMSRFPPDQQHGDEDLPPCCCRLR
jgi:hypothetical protein